MQNVPVQGGWQLLNISLPVLLPFPKLNIRCTSPNRNLQNERC